MAVVTKGRCFVAGAFGDPLTERVTERAGEIGLDVVTALDARPSGQSVRSALDQLIRGADLVIALAGSSRLPLFELGVATARNRPVLLITPPRMSDLPLEVADVPRLSTEVLETDEFPAAVELLLRHRPPAPHRRRTRQRPLGSYANVLLKQEPAVQNEQDLVELIGHVFEKLGVEITRQQKVGGKRADVVAWNERLTSLGANPLIVEIKGTITLSAVAEMRRRFESLLPAAGSRVGLVVYLDGPGRSVEQLEDGGRLVLVQWRDLVERLRDKPLPDVMSSLLRMPPKP